ncbi:hypothetical protein CALCODRAFT_458663 [Calocera cornea HHB12733]|uniref:Uncharacterized protein n=1 Tax=Calocera cornea HHB12733 TaxID=1353952 RepID=A0A165DIT7_9BASI|nr:hypothetical protein CALCODRAFT_458663 [Calocera cornea HHB12733]
MQPAMDPGFKLVFSPTASAPDDRLAVLKTAVTKLTAQEKFPYPAAVALSYADAKATPGYKILSTAPWMMYHTWINVDDYAKVNKVLKIGASIRRAWPTQAAATALVENLYNELKVTLHTGWEPQAVKLTLAKMQATKGPGSKRNPGQKTVMGASATTFANKFWPGAVDKNANPKNAEWLHRSAFHFGGVSDFADLASSQTQDNLVFGTGEANTHMIREEHFLDMVVDHFQPSDPADAPTLITNINPTSKVTIFDIDLVRKEEAVPPWVIAAKYKWLCLSLEYRLKYQNGVHDFNYMSTIDPFSRYYPFRCEVELDELMFDKLVAAPSTPATATSTTTTSTTTTSTTTPPVSAKFVVRTVASNPSTVDGPSHAQVWEAAASSAPSVVSNGTAVQNPSVVPALTIAPGGVSLPGARAPAGTAASVIPSASASAPPVDGFTLVGDITLFGIKGLTAKFYSWKGPLPAGIVMGLIPPVYDQAVIDGDFHLSMVIDKLQGTPFDKIPFRNTTFTYQNYPFDTTKALGWHVEADIIIDESCGAAHDVLSKALRVQEPDLHVHACIGATQNWSTALKIPSFTLDGSFSGISAKICDELTLTSIGLQLLGSRAMQMYPEPKEVMKYGFGVFGTMHLSVPGSIIPLELSFDITEMAGMATLSADLCGDFWNDAFGISGLTLTDVAVTASFGITTPLSTFNFGVLAMFEHGATKAYFEGSYAAGGGFAISATVSDFTLNNVFDLADRFTGAQIKLPSAQVTIGSATIAVASGSGLTVALQNVQFGEYMAADATLTLSKTGISLRGDITSHDVLTFGEVEVKKAFIQIDFQSVNGAKETDVLLGGEVTIESLTIDAAIHVYEDATGPQWTIYAALTTAGNSLALSKLVSELHGTFLDLSLTQVSFCAASKDDPLMQSFIFSSTPYAFHQGVQINATVGNIDAMNALMRAPAGGFILSAGWSKATGFTLDIMPPSSTIVHLGKGISTDPFTLQIQTAGGAPGLMLYAGVKIPTAQSDTPLDFKLALSIDPVGARASAELDGWWVDPFGISKNVKIGPLVALSIEIIFEQFLTTGIPSGFGIAGGLQIGKAAASLALEISEDPMHELLSAEVKNLDINDVVDFAKLLTGLAIPQPDNFLQFTDVKLYICPAGTTLGSVTYPRGFSFDAAMVVFGKNASIDCNVSTSGASIKGSVDDFKLGPLEVRGTAGPQATLDVEVGLSKQHLGIDGMATFYEAEVALHVDLDVLPKPAFSFFATLKFTDLLLFALNAELVGAVDFKSLESADFLFDALMEQHILQYVSDELNKQFDLAKQAAEEGVESAQKKVDDEKAKMQAAIDAAQKKLDAASATWTAKRNAVTKSSQATITNYNGNIAALQKKVSLAQAAYTKAQADAHNKLQSATNDRATKLAAAQHSVDDARNKMNGDITNAQNKVSSAEAKMQKDFGNAEHSIDEAQNKVNGLQNDINKCEKEISDLNHLSKFNPKRAEVVKYGSQLAGYKVGKEAADKALDVAKAIIKGTGYVADQTAIKAAQGALDAAKSGGAITLSAAQETLKGVDTATAGAVKAAQASVDGLGKCSEAVAFTAAEGALAGFKRANDAAFAAATKALSEITGCAEKIAFDAATAGLDAAKHASIGLDAADGALKLAEDGGELALDAAKWAVDHAASLCDITVIHLSGSLRGILGLTGKVEKPLTAHVEGQAAGHAFSWDGTFDPRKTADFIKGVFEKLWNDIKSEAIKLK